MNAVRSGGEVRDELLRTLAANVDAKRDLCLRLEVLAGLESPSEFAQERMQFQVSRLTEAFGADRYDLASVADDDSQELERVWLGLGVLPSTENLALESRIQRAWEVLLES